MSAPWFLMGDFNAVYSNEERSSSVTSRLEKRNFDNFINDFDFMEFDRLGTRITFSNNQTPHSFSHLDLYLSSVSWMECFSTITKNALGFFNSDHKVVHLKPSTFVDGGPIPFRFQPHWFEEMVLLEQLDLWWAEFDFQGNVGYVLHKKLKSLKGKIKDRVKVNFNKIEKKIACIEGLLGNVELEEEDKLLSSEEQANQKKLQLKLQQAICQEEALWSKKARLLW